MMIDDAIGILTHGAAVTFMTRLGAARLCLSRRSLRSLDGGLDDVRDVFSGRCIRSTRSINSSFVRRCKSVRSITA